MSEELDVLKKGVYELKRPKYDEMYDVLAGFRIILKKDPVESGLAPINDTIEQIQSMKSDLISIFLDAIHNKDRWQRAWRAAWAYYESRLKQLLNDRAEELKSLRSYEERKNRVDKDLEDEINLIKYVEKHYYKEGYQEGGQAVNFLEAVKTVKESLESTNSNLRLQITIIEHMMALGEVSLDAIKSRQRAKLSIGGKNAS